MSRIDDLLDRLCPEGVKHMALNEVAAYSDTRTDANVLDSRSFVGVDNLLPGKGGKVDASYLPNTARLTAYAVGDTLIGNIRPYLKKAWLATNSGGCSGDVLAVRIEHSFKARLEPAFLFAVLSSDRFFEYDMQHAKGAKMPRGSKEAIMRYRIPVPPLEVQREIVRVLDQFTQLEAELEAELEARRRQFEHYRDRLLAFPEAGGGLLMREAGFFFRGLAGKSRADFKDGNAHFVSYLNILNNPSVDLHRDDRVQVAQGERQHVLQQGDILFTASSETANEVGMSSVVTEVVASPVYLNSFSIGYRMNDPHLLDEGYAKHLFRSRDMRRQIIAAGNGVTRFNLSRSRLGEVKFPVPDLSEQKCVADTLDRFERIIGDLNVGLPAELAARRKQYEYYRDRLLTFKEAS